jgi:hypothetical protein
VWTRALLEYFEVFETRMIAEDYGIRGTITMFNGLHFDDENPYTYREGKRLIRLLGDELQKRKDLHKLGVDPTGERRTAITGRGSDRVWDFLRLQQARGAAATAHPHLTMGINANGAIRGHLEGPLAVGRGGDRSRAHRQASDAITLAAATTGLD